MGPWRNYRSWFSSVKVQPHQEIFAQFSSPNESGVGLGGKRV